MKSNQSDRVTSVFFSYFTFLLQITSSSPGDSTGRGVGSFKARLVSRRQCFFHSFRDLMDELKLRLLSFNVFPGSPFPYIGGGITRLAASDRLDSQIVGIRALKPDVAFLQELYCVHSLKRYIDAFPDYTFFTLPCHNTRGRVIYAAIVGILSAIAVTAVWLICRFVPSNHSQLTTHGQYPVFAALFVVLCLVVHVCIGRSATAQWLRGSAAGLVTMTRKCECIASCQVVVPASRFFISQSGDPLNFFAPRGILTVSAEMSNGHKLMLFNTHLNQSQETHGNHRLSQACEVLDAISHAVDVSRDAGRQHITVILGGDLNNSPESPEVILIKENSALKDAFSAAAVTVGEQTWLEANPLTHPIYVRGMPDSRIDFIVVDKHVRVDSCSTALGGPYYVSDHLAVVADVTLVCDGGGSETFVAGVGAGVLEGVANGVTETSIKLLPNKTRRAQAVMRV